MRGAGGEGWHPRTMPDFALIHGGAHGAWCWDRLVPFLAADPRVGQVLAIDLCGHGHRLGDKPQRDISLADYHSSALEDLERHDLRDAVLVGHSLAGITIPVLAHRAPERIRHLVYLATTNPARGRRVLDVMSDPRSPVSRGADMNAAFCSDCDEATSAWLVDHLGPQPPGPLMTRIETVRGPVGVPQTYVVCEADEVLPADYQQEQAEIIEADEVLRLPTGHSPFASQPAALADLLLGLIPD